MDRVLHFVLALVVVTALALLVSTDRKKIRIRYVVQLLVIEVLLAWFFLNSNVGLGFVKGFSEMFEKLLGFANEGTNFVFGKMNDEGLAFFFLKVLCPIVFISALIGILQHIRVLPFVIRGIGFLLSKVNGMGKLESFNAVSSLILGQSENFIAYKDILGKMSRNRMYTMAATAMSTVSMSIVGAYMTMLEPKYVVAALVLNMFSTFIVLSLINPYRVDASEENIQMSNLHEGQSFFEMLGEYILAGFKVAIIVAAMLIGFISLIALINYLFTAVFGMNFQTVMGYLFYPLAWVLGIPSAEAMQAGSMEAITALVWVLRKVLVALHWEHLSLLYLAGPLLVSLALALGSGMPLGKVIDTMKSSFGNTLGGICGYNNNGTISECLNTGTLTIDATVPSDGTGGIVGYCGKGTITGCGNTGGIGGTGRGQRAVAVGHGDEGVEHRVEAPDTVKGVGNQFGARHLAGRQLAGQSFECVGHGIHAGRPAAQAAGTKSFNDFGHQVQAVLDLRSDCLVGGAAVRFGHRIGAQAQGSVLRMGHGLDAGGVHGTHGLDQVENSVELTLHRAALGLADAQPRKPGNLDDVI